MQNFYRQTCVQAGFRMQNNSNLTTVRISSSILLSKEERKNKLLGKQELRIKVFWCWITAKAPTLWE